MRNVAEVLDANLGFSEYLFGLHLRIPELILMSQACKLALLFETLDFVLQSSDLGSEILVANICHCNISPRSLSWYSRWDKPGFTLVLSLKV